LAPQGSRAGTGRDRKRARAGPPRATLKQSGSPRSGGVYFAGNPAGSFNGQQAFSHASCTGGCPDSAPLPHGKEADPMKNVINNHPRTILAGALSVALMFAAGGVMAQDADHERDHSTVMDNDSDQPINDTWITTKVKSSLLADSDVAGLDVSVETVNGVEIGRA